MRALRASAVALALATACSPSREEPSLSADAKLETLRTLREDLEAVRHPADGGGRAWLEFPVGPVVAGSRQRFEIVYEAGPLGVEPGGAVVLQPSPFWGWDAPQASRPEAPGYTEVSTDAPGLRVEPLAPAPQLLAFGVEGRKLEAGERLRIVYGAGRLKARVDRFAERGSPIWIAVDGDGDGIRSLVENAPKIDLVAGAPSRLVASLPSTAEPGETLRLTLAVLDAQGNAGVSLEGEVTLRGPGGLRLPGRARLEEGWVEVEVVPKEPGVYRVWAAAGELEAESNPLVVRDGIPRLLWADLHGHSQLSDGTGTPEDYYRYARDVAGLDVAALTDHDHWGMRFLDETPALWEEIRGAARRANEPGRFVALSGYEWTSWLYGHRHVLYFDDGGELLSSMDPSYETPERLWSALGGRPALTVAHHSAGGPISTSWTHRPDPALEPVTEIASVHGSSEASDAAAPIYAAVPGNFVRDVIGPDLRLGFIGSGDGHDGHPGLARLGSASAGLAAIFAEEATREAVLEALRARRVYATNGVRIWLRVWLEPLSEWSLRFAVAGTAPVARVDVIRGGTVAATLAGGGRRELSETLALPGLAPGEYVYLRVLQEDGGAAWSSPLYADDMED